MKLTKKKNILISILKKILNKIIGLILSEKKWLLPKKNDLLILDRTGVDKITKTIIGKTKFSVFDVRNESINIPILIYSIIFFFKYGINSYKICFIKYIKPKVVLTFIDTLINFSILIEKIPGTKFMMIMNGKRHEHEIKVLDTRKKYRLDYYFVFGDYYQKFVEKKISCEVISTGSIIANSLKKPNFKKISKIQFISSWSPAHLEKYYKKSSIREYYEVSKFILKNIVAFAKKNNFLIEVLSRTNFLEEENFYKDIFKDYIYIKKNTDNFYSNYNKLSEDAIIAGQDSTLLMECFGLGYRTAFFTIADRNLDDDHPDHIRFFPWCWPQKLNDRGFFWSNVRNNKYILEVLENLRTVNEMSWKEKVLPYQLGAMRYDYNNKIIKDILKKEGLLISPN
jgi:surface carbohydrate biosynthesis protein